MNKLSSAFVAAALGLAAGSAIRATDAFAQASSTAGALRGVLKDKGSNNQPAVGATIVATSPALVTEQVVISEADGQYFISSLPPGLYTLTIYYSDQTFSRGNVLIQVGKEAVVNVTVDSTAGKGSGETIVLQGSAPIIDQGSTKTGVTITEEFTRHVPTGRTFANVLGTTAGSQADQFGTSISGATSAENIYVIEGINTTDTGFGTLSSNLPNEFIGETEVISGGYNAEFGRATGGIVNVVTKQGSNVFKGSVYGNFSPGSFIATAKQVQREGSSLDLEDNVDYRYDFGAEIGGPIIKDKLWFHVGFNPFLVSTTRTRSVASQVDRDMDGVADTDSETGLTIREQVASSDNTTTTQTYFYTAKINGAINQNNQFQISLFGNPVRGTVPYGVNGDPARRTIDIDQGAYDAAGKFTSKFNDGKTQIDAVVGFHRQITNATPRAAQLVPVIAWGYDRSLYDFETIEGGAATIGKCQDGGANDPYPGIVNCPTLNYATGGGGVFNDRTNDRYSGVLAVTQRIKAAGYHTFKAGFDGELATYDAHTYRTGGSSWLVQAPSLATGKSRWRATEYLEVVRNLTPDELADPDSVMLSGRQLLCADGRAVCDVSLDGYAADTNNTNLAAFIQDSWQIRPNLTLNAGLRWENQTGYVATGLAGKPTPEGETVPEAAYELKNMLSPRLGFIYDPTSEGKSKIFGHWGRFYETVPMDLNVRAFGGEIQMRTNYNNSRLAADAAGYDPSCDLNFQPGVDQSKQIQECQDTAITGFIGEHLTYVTPGLEGQYSQELIFGAEYEFVPDLKLGVNYIHRTMPQVIEDISTDGGNTYFITNPGRDFSDEADALRRQADEMGDSPLAEVYRSRAKNMEAIGRFDKPSRNYDAVAVTAVQRPTKRSLLQASYTYSMLKGNYAGLFSTETGQLDPNITSLYDLPDLMANRYGPGGLDRPHNLRVDGFYQFDLKKAGILNLGASFRAQSGIAHNALGGHPIYGGGESYLLPRGAVPRSPVTSQTDVQVGYGYRVSKTTTFEGFFRVFNLFNAQEEVNVDEVYTFDNANPVVGGTPEDLKHVKQVDRDVFTELNETVKPNKNFGRLNTRQAPLAVQLGFRLTF